MPPCRKADSLTGSPMRIRPRKAGRGQAAWPVPQSDTGVLGEYPKAFGRTLVKELGKMTPYPRYKGCSLARGSRRESALATVYQKHRTLPTRKRTYRV